MLFFHEICVDRSLSIFTKEWLQIADFTLMAHPSKRFGFSPVIASCYSYLYHVTMNLGPLSFQTIDLSSTTDLCIRFREDSFVASFGDGAKFYEEDGKGAERYTEWLRNKISKDPASAVHVWLDSVIIGQIELGTFKAEPDVGNVNLYYLVPDKRGLGYSRYLDEYAISYLKGLGLKKSRLSVSPTNIRALRFYAKQGWRDIGPRPGHPEVHWMEKTLS